MSVCDTLDLAKPQKQTVKALDVVLSADIAAREITSNDIGAFVQVLHCLAKNPNKLLHAAAAAHDKAMVLLALRNGANIGHEENGWCVMGIACTADLEFYKFLVQHGAKPSAVVANNPSRRTLPIFALCERASADVLEYYCTELAYSFGMQPLRDVCDDDGVLCTPSLYLLARPDTHVPLSNRMIHSPQRIERLKLLARNGTILELPAGGTKTDLLYQTATRYLDSFYILHAIGLADLILYYIACGLECSLVGEKNASEFLRSHTTVGTEDDEIEEMFAPKQVSGTIRKYRLSLVMHDIMRVGCALGKELSALVLVEILDRVNPFASRMPLALKWDRLVAIKHRTS